MTQLEKAREEIRRKQYGQQHRSVDADKKKLKQSISKLVQDFYDKHGLGVKVKSRTVHQGGINVPKYAFASTVVAINPK